MEKILSIVIPAYNVEKYLERCLASFEVAEILDQIEVLVINDGSKDQTAAVAQRYCDRIRISFIIRRTGDMVPVSITESTMPGENILRLWMEMTG
jgi:glycosyltransferase involved in cell wall biosynthesis